MEGAPIRGAAALLTLARHEVSLRRFDVPPPPPGGMAVRVRYGGICGTDLHLIDGHLPIPAHIVLGHEGLGTIAAIAPDAGGDLRPGDTVMWASSISCGTCPDCTDHQAPTLCPSRRTYGVNRDAMAGEPLSGAWAEYIVLERGTRVLRLPEGVDPIAAMSLACAGPTIMHAYERRPVRASETVIVQGAGPVGIAAAALARLRGAAHVTVIGGPTGRIEALRGLGLADALFDITEAGAEAANAAALAALPRPGGADLVVECTGVPEAFPQMLGLTRRGGACLVVGQYTDSGPISFHPHQIVYRDLDVVGSWAFSGDHLAAYVEALPALTARFDLASIVTTRPLTRVGEAVAEVRAGRCLKMVLDCQ
jgi:threonine dehydrogenase-like Zn-dependent dehydrogenase